MALGVGPPVAGFLLPLAPLALYGGSAALLAAATLVLIVVNVASWRRSPEPQIARR